MKKLITSLGIIGALAAGCSKDNITTPVTPIDNSSKYTIINQKSNSKIYETFMIGFNDPGNGGLGLKDTTNINRYLNTGYYNTGLKDYYLGDIGLKQYMDSDAKMKISGGKEISEDDLSRYFDLINSKINIGSFKKDIIVKDMVKFIENEYIPSKIKNNEEFIGNNYLCLLSVPRKYFAGGPSGFMLDFKYTDNGGDTKQGVIAIVSAGNEYYKENENWKLGSIKSITNTGLTHEPFHFHVSESLKSLGKQPKDLGASIDASSNILDKDGNLIIDKDGHVKDYYSTIVDGQKIAINSMFSSGSGANFIFPTKKKLYYSIKETITQNLLKFLKYEIELHIL